MTSSSEYVPEFSESERAAIFSEFSKLTAGGIYLDHAGATLYADAQIDAVTERLKRNLLCNPHTNSSTNDLMDQVRYKILDFFNTSTEQYYVVFTANATAALKLVAETFDSNGQGNFYYCKDNHTSVLGMRNVLNVAGQYMLTKEQLLKNLECNENRCAANCDANEVSSAANSLVAFAAQCNFSGFKFPLSLIEHIQRNGLCVKGRKVSSGNDNGDGNGNAAVNGRDSERYFVCLDAASFVGTNFLDLSAYTPDFVTISFYKIFGYPTGVGALLVSRRGAEALNKEKRYYGGGTINYTYPDTLKCSLRAAFHERFEDGTLPFISIAELLEGYRTLERLVPLGADAKHLMQRVARHVHGLAKYCYAELAGLRHANGKPVIEFYNFRGYADEATQGGIVSFNLLNDYGLHIGFSELACIAALHNVLLRTGCFCNLGACASYLGLSHKDMEEQFFAGRKCGDYNDLLNGQPTGAVRISFGYMSRIEDVDQFVQLLRNCFVSVRLAERLHAIEQDAAKLPAALQYIAQRMRIKVERLFVYPVKAGAAYEIHDSWPVCSYGFKYDRQWMVVDASGRSMTQTREPGLCLLTAEVLLTEGQLKLGFPGMAPMCVPLEMPTNLAAQKQSKVCSAPVSGQDCGDAVAEWLARCFNLDGVRLLRQMHMKRTFEGKLMDLSLVNQGQFLIVNVATARWLVRQFDRPICGEDPFCDKAIESLLKRFRANIIIDTGTPLEENELTNLELDGIDLVVDSPCTRCEIICVDQDNADTQPEVLRSLGHALAGKREFGIYASFVKPPPEQACIRRSTPVHVVRLAAA